MTAPESLEPEVEVTEADRRAAMDFLETAPVGDKDREYWVARGKPARKGYSFAYESRLAHAIARARTMGAFEERCRAVRAFMDAVSTGGMADFLGVDKENYRHWYFLNADITDDDIRHLVLAGRAKGGE